MTVIVPRLAVRVATLGIQTTAVGKRLRTHEQKQHYQYLSLKNHRANLQSSDDVARRVRPFWGRLSAMVGLRAGADLGGGLQSVENDMGAGRGKNVVGADV